MENQPKVFISYSRSSQFQDELLNLAASLKRDGVDVLFDKWDLKTGHDVNQFAQLMAEEAGGHKILIVSDRVYLDKIDGLIKDGSAHTKIVSPALFHAQDRRDFMALVFDKDHLGEPYLPHYYKGQPYLDLSHHEAFEKNYPRLLDWIFEKP